MHYRMIAILLAFLSIAVPLGSTGLSDEPWQLTRGIELTSRSPQGLAGFGEDRVTAVLYRPKIEGKMPSAVIINSSGGEV